jgi:hypothetical protein
MPPADDPKRSTAEGLAHRPRGRFGNRVQQDQYVDHPIWGLLPFAENDITGTSTAPASRR